MERPPVTVLDVLKNLFPRRGSKQPPYPIWPGQKIADGDQAYHDLPIHPFDVFAATANLIELSGAYHHIVAGGDNATRRRFRRERLRHRSERMLALRAGRLEACRNQAKLWREPVAKLGTAVPRDERDERIQQLIAAIRKRRDDLSDTAKKWSELFAQYGSEPVFQILNAKSPPPKWWQVALELMITADEASEGVGFTPIQLDPASWSDLYWFERPYVRNMREEFLRRSAMRDNDAADNGIPQHRSLAYTSLSDARQDVACVLPKARTTAVGCTLRSLSHHLALLPAKGIARGRWYPAVDMAATLDDVELNVLLVPFPFSISDTSFHGFLGRTRVGTSFGFFEVKPDWLGREDPKSVSLFIDKLYAFVVDLAADALTTHQATSIDAIVFPELALRFDVYVALKARLKERFPDLEVFVSGLSDDGKGRQGNFVAVSTMPKSQSPSPKAKSSRDHFTTDPAFSDAMRTTVREKHHRWKLDRHQLDGYGLSGALNPKLDWWEDIDLLSRRVDFTVFRKNSVIAAMICEDLARVDPCQELLRAVGPNLVVALLMDAPQLPTRWPARYATILSDDPGSSVLTLTSRALMTRQHVLGLRKSEKPEDRVIALWRDDHYGVARPIACPHDCHGVWLKLWSSRTTDTSLDGRVDTSGQTWIYGKDRPLRIPNVAERYPEILGKDDVSLQVSPKS